MVLTDIKCGFCNKGIDVLLVNGEQHVDTKYWREVNPRIYFCDGYCATGLYEKEQNNKQQD